MHIQWALIRYPTKTIIFSLVTCHTTPPQSFESLKIMADSDRGGVTVPLGSGADPDIISRYICPW